MSDSDFYLGTDNTLHFLKLFIILFKGVWRLEGSGCQFSWLVFMFVLPT